jgi:eukaryotic-like serine/threonine-protein kinase
MAKRDPDNSTVKQTPRSSKTALGRASGAPADTAQASRAKNRPGSDEGADEKSPPSSSFVAPLPGETPPPSELGRYQLLFELARGGMGAVYVGRLRGAHGVDRLVAIKRLKTDGATEEDVTAFLAEARITAQMQHPNVVKTIELGEHAGLPFLVMDLIEGVSLSRLVRRLGRNGIPVDPRIAIWIAAQAATGLHAAHELRNVEGEPYGLVHRDVSPENVLLSYDGRVYVADFGVAKLTGDRQTQSGVVKGKFAYMSPEQTEAMSLDRRSDVFALGIVLHECLTGDRLFQGNSAADTIRRIWSVEPSDPSRGRDDVPPEVGSIVLRCLEKDRERRYDSAGEVAEALRRVLRERGDTVDETDVEAMLAEHFHAERDELRARVRESLRQADSEVSLLPGRRSQATLEQGSVTASVSTGPPLDRRGWAGAGIVAAVALVAGAIFWIARDDHDAGPVAPTAVPATAATAEPHIEPTNSAPLPLPTATATSSASAAAVPKVAVPHGPPPPPPVGPPPVTSSHKGVPFGKIGP